MGPDKIFMYFTTSVRFAGCDGFLFYFCENEVGEQNQPKSKILGLERVSFRLVYLWYRNFFVFQSWELCFGYVSDDVPIRSNPEFLSFQHFIHMTFCIPPQRNWKIREKCDLNNKIVDMPNCSSSTFHTISLALVNDAW